MRAPSANRRPLEELWAREYELVSLLTSEVAHDLNNLLASLQANAFLIRGTVSGEEAQALESIEAAVGLGNGLVEQLRLLHSATAAPPAEPPLRVEAAAQAVPALLQRLERADVVCSVSLEDGAKDLLISSALFRGGFLALVTLAVELLPPGGTLAVGARVRTGRARLWLSLDKSELPAFLQHPSSGLADLPLTRMVRWLSLRAGGDLTISDDGKRFELFVPQDAQSSDAGSALQRAQ